MYSYYGIVGRYIRSHSFFYVFGDVPVMTAVKTALLVAILRAVEGIFKLANL